MGLMVGAILFITSSVTVFFFGLENLKVFHWSFLVEFLIFGILCQPLVLGIYLRVGILEWAKRHVVSIWSRMGLEVIAGVLVLAFMAASAVLSGLGIFFTSTEYRGRSYLEQGKYQETVKMLGPLVYLYIQPRQEMISQKKYKAAMEVLGRLYQERPGWLMVGLGPNIFTQANLAVALAKNGDPAGARAVIDVLIEAGERLYPSDYKESRLTGYEGMPVYEAFAEIYLIDHTISPDGAGLDEFEKGVPEKDRGKALRYLGHVLRDQGKKEAALVALRRALGLLETDSKDRQKVQEEVRKLQAAGGEGAGQR
jgi:tetratricopeptide (TPR) repeat protein